VTEGSALDVTPEAFARLVRGAGDEEIRTVVRGLGTGDVLQRVFDEMERRFLPEKARGVDAVIQFVVTDGDEEHRYGVTVREGSCSLSRGRVAEPSVTLAMDLVPFMRLVAGEARGPTLYVTGKLRVTGNPMLAAGVASFFRTPEP
jgi:putative sterol carrier protein